MKSSYADDIWYTAATLSDNALLKDLHKEKIPGMDIYYELHSCTPFQASCYENNEEAAKLFIKWGVDLDRKDGDGDTMLSYCFDTEKWSIVLEILKHKPSLEGINDFLITQAPKRIQKAFQKVSGLKKLGKYADLL